MTAVKSSAKATLAFEGSDQLSMIHLDFDKRFSDMDLLLLGDSGPYRQTNKAGLSSVTRGRR